MIAAVAEPWELNAHENTLMYFRNGVPSQSVLAVRENAIDPGF